MRIIGLRSILTPKFRICTTDSKHNNHIAENLLDRKVVGWSQSSDMTTADTVIPAFKMAIKHRCKNC